MKKLCVFALLGWIFFFVPRFATANNVQISNVTATGSNLSFSIAWDNSWRVSATAPYNYDAVWVFVKYKDCAGNQWSHARIDSAGAGAGLQADTTSDHMGVMVYRSSDGVGNVSNTTVTVNLEAMPAGNFDFKVFGIEMVYVPQGAYSLGDGSSYYAFRTGTTTALPYQMTTDSAVVVANSGSNLFASGGQTSGTIPVGYPTGYDAFYCMKYEISQIQYAEFVNTLTSTQAAARYLVSGANRYTLTGAWPVISATAGNRAHNFMNYDDEFAYLDWSGLRPMSEMEFEKACRGPVAHVPGEYAWGTTLVTDANTLATDGTPTETATNAIPAGSGIANYNNSSVLGPIRCGFNGSGASNRLTLGASYYGICELSGNVAERIVHARNSAGWNYVANHGDGEISPVGLFTVTGWPLLAGTGKRGGGYNDTPARLAVSDRYNAIFGNNTRYAYMGGRGVRTAD